MVTYEHPVYDAASPTFDTLCHFDRLEVKQTHPPDDRSSRVRFIPSFLRVPCLEFACQFGLAIQPECRMTSATVSRSSDCVLSVARLKRPTTPAPNAKIIHFHGNECSSQRTSRFNPESRRPRLPPFMILDPVRTKRYILFHRNRTFSRIVRATCAGSISRGTPIRNPAWPAPARSGRPSLANEARIHLRCRDDERPTISQYYRQSWIARRA